MSDKRTWYGEYSESVRQRAFDRYGCDCDDCCETLVIVKGEIEEIEIPAERLERLYD